MKELSPQARAILEAAAPLDEPSENDRARVREAVMSAVATGTAAATAGAASSAAASSSAASTAVAASGVAGGGTVAGVSSMGLAGAKAVAALAALAATVGVATTQPWGEAAEPGVAAPAEARSGGDEAPLVEGRGSRGQADSEEAGSEEADSEEADSEDGIAGAAFVEAQPSETAGNPASFDRSAAGQRIDSPTDLQQTTAGSPSARSRVAAAAQPPSGADQSTPDPLAAEIVLLRRARRALGEGDLRAALAALDEHQARFADGALAAERAGTRALVLCMRDGSSEAARAFLRDHPRSPLAPRVRAACDLGPDSDLLRRSE